jgi:vacuolar-type H+-ATPase subunit I/STV1
MFGDIGHGLIMFLAALWMVWKEKSLQAQRINNEVSTSFRRLLLLFRFAALAARR